MCLKRMKLMYMVRLRVEPADFWRNDIMSDPPRNVYYLTDLGYDAHDYWQRQRR
jgi:hypothetical protein